MDIVCVVYLYILSTYHLFSGVVSMFFPAFAMMFYKGMYGCDPLERRHLVLILKFWGALAFFAGVAGLFSAHNPQGHPGIVVGLLLLLMLRVFFRAQYERELTAISGISPMRNRMSIGLIVVGIAILGIWLFRNAEVLWMGAPL